MKQQELQTAGGFTANPPAFSMSDEELLGYLLPKEYARQFLAEYGSLYEVVMNTSDEELANLYKDDDVVIINEWGGYRDPSQFSYVVFKRILKKAEIARSFRFHDLRHTHATWPLEKGVHVKVVSERLGHSSIRITLDTYGHVLKTMQEQAVKAMNQILDDDLE